MGNTDGYKPWKNYDDRKKKPVTGLDKPKEHKQQLQLQEYRHNGKCRQILNTRHGDFICSLSDTHTGKHIYKAY